MTLNLLKFTGFALLCLFLMMLPASAVPMITTIGPHSNLIKLMPTPIPDPSVLKTVSAESKIMDSRVIIGNFTKQLEFLNNEMNWNLTPEQLNNYSASMRNGVLKKYVYNPQYPETLDIPNQRQFYFEIGNELGLTQEESAKIVQKIEENYRKNFESTDPPSWDKSSIPNLQISSITPLRTPDMPTQEAHVGAEIGLIALGCGGLIFALKR